MKRCFLPCLIILPGSFKLHSHPFRPCGKSFNHALCKYGRNQTSITEFDTRRKTRVERRKVSNPCLQGRVRPHLSVRQSVTRSKTKIRETASLQSPAWSLPGQFSNSFYENADEIYALKKTLIEQGILSGERNRLALARD